VIVEQEINELILHLESIKFICNKKAVMGGIASKFNLARDRAVYQSTSLAVRFSTSNTSSFKNTVLSLSALQKIDDRPVVVCLITPTGVSARLANSTLLRKISHSSQDLCMDNIKGSFNGSDIKSELNGIKNMSANIIELFKMHTKIGFMGNLERLVDATHGIVPTGKAFIGSKEQLATIMDSPARTVKFLDSKNSLLMKKDLDLRVKKYAKYITLSSKIENVNIRGRVIEYLISGVDCVLIKKICNALESNIDELPVFKTENALGDFERRDSNYNVDVDIKTKVMALHSNPKAYNIDKILEFLSTPKSVFVFYFVGLGANGSITTAMTSMFQAELLKTTTIQKHWSGRNSRGVTQLDGDVLHKLIKNSPSVDIDIKLARRFLKALVSSN
jgi:hypothetical protein